MREDFRTHIDNRLAIELWVRRASYPWAGCGSDVLPEAQSDLAER
jgi:hypothetical protein